MRRSAASVIGGVGLAAASAMGLAVYSSRIARQAEAMVPPDGKFIDIDGTRLHYLDVGEGPAIVLVHGLGGQLRNFSYALLDRLTGSHRVILVDRPGSGYSSVASGSAPGLLAQGALIVGLIEALGVERPLLVGHSLGGAVALGVGLDHPDAIAGLVLLAPLTQVQEEVPAAFRGLAAIPASLRLLFARTVGTPMSRLTAKRTLEAIFAPEPVPDDFPVRGGGLLSQRPANIAAAAEELGGVNDDLAPMVARYGTLTVPTAILFGRGDEVLDPAVHGTRTAAEIPGARSGMIDGGHMIPVTQPDRTAAFIKAQAARVLAG